MSRKKYGFFCGVAAYILWGLLPIYWKLLKAVPAYEILSHRILWSFIFVAIILLSRSRMDTVSSIFKQKKKLAVIGLCSIFISINWFIYIWAVNSGHVLDTSMGYYITPLINVLFGMLVFHEKLALLQKIAMAIALAGVCIMIGFYGHIPWISFSLALSFSLYGIFKKKVNVDSLAGLGIETLLVAPIAIAYILGIGLHGKGSYGSSAVPTALLTLAGVVTATPLLLFAEGVRNVKLTIVGFMQYISPTIGLILGLLVFNEHFTSYDFIGFGFTWVALVLYSIPIIQHEL